MACSLLAPCLQSASQCPAQEGLVLQKRPGERRPISEFIGLSSTGELVSLSESLHTK
jgi:hypothetical protein